MNNTVYDVDFTRALPDPLKNDEKMLALGRVIAGELQENIRLARIAIIYPLIDELPEWLLDILAWDLHIDWYIDTHPIEAKRQVIKDSVRVHKRLGTRYAMVTGIGSVFPRSEVQEWFEYGGTHHRFRILLDMTEANAPADFDELMWAIKFFRRLTAHLDEIIYQMSAIIEVSIETTAFTFRQGVTGQYRAGERPHRYKGGAVRNAVVEVAPDAWGAKHTPPRTGTRPHRSTTAALRELEIIADNEAAGFTKRFGMTGEYNAGERPDRYTGGGAAGAVVEVAPDVAGHIHTPRLTGTQPHRNKTAREKPGALTPIITAESFSFHVRRCGTSLTKNN